jgi:hypothetical protein
VVLKKKLQILSPRANPALVLHKIRVAKVLNQLPSQQHQAAVPEKTGQKMLK